MSDAALEALDEKLCDERRQAALDALSDRHVDALRGRLLLARVDANNVLQVLPAAQRIGDGLAKAVTELQGDDMRTQALELIERHAAEHERVDDMLADARLKQQEALRRRVRERLMRSETSRPMSSMNGLNWRRTWIGGR